MNILPTERSGIGYGGGYGSGYGNGHGSGSGFGDGFGYGSGFGDGHGDGDGDVVGQVGEHLVIALSPWPYVRVGCQAMSIKAWRSQWKEIAESEGIMISKAFVEELLRKSEEAVDG